MAHVLLIDNYDSFVWNLAQAFEALHARVTVVRHDAIRADDVAATGATHLCISPGPKAPDEAGVSLEVIRNWHGRLPILGVCLGHQCIGAAFGAAWHRVPPVHGKSTRIEHDGLGLFAGLPQPMVAARYHSLAVARESWPQRLRVTAWLEGQRDDDRAIPMALEVIDGPTFGVQIHPESYLTPDGPRLLANFLAVCAPTPGADATRPAAEAAR